MTIGIDARELSGQPAGKGQYLLRMVVHWIKNSDARFMLYTKPGQILPVHCTGPTVRHVEVSGKGLLWHLTVGQRLKSDGVQTFFASLSYLSCLANPVPTTTVVHDLAVFRLPGLSHNRRAQIIERLSLKRAIKKSAVIIAVSQSTKRDLVELMGAKPESIDVLYEAAMLEDDGIAPLSKDQRQPYFLFTGTLEPRKNILVLLKAYATLPGDIRKTYRLKLAGKPGWGGEDYQSAAGDLGIASTVDFLGYVSNEELKRLFANAFAFAYPSLYEGFGLPVVEAMAVGTPVVTSNVSSLPEVVGPNGISCDPLNVEAVAECLRRLVEEKGLWESQSAYLYERSKIFRWEDIAAQTLDLIKASA